METWQWLLIGLIAFLIVAAGYFIVFGYFSQQSVETGKNVFSGIFDAFVGWLG